MINTSIRSLSGMFPTREEEPHGENYLVTITPPAFMGGEPQKVILTPDQFARYLTWKDRGVLIQNALPDLSPSDREKLMSGLDDEGFKKACGSSDEEE
jgi:hypothetical protein